MATSKTVVGLSTDLQTLKNGGAAELTFVFSDVPHNFTLADLIVKNGVVTNLTQDLYSPYIYRADFIGGVSDKSGMSTIQLNGAYTNSSGVLGAPSNTVTIKNFPVEQSTHEPTVGFTCNNTSVIEGNSGTTDMKFTVTLSEASDKYVTVNYTTNQKLFGTAFTDADYIAKDSVLVFAPGETSKVITIDVVGDTNYEATESFYVDLISCSGASIVTNGAEGLRSNWAVGNIVNDDVAPMPTVSFNTNNSSILEGNSGTTVMGFTVNLSSASSEIVTVDYTTEQKLFGTAKGGTDFVPTTGSLVFNPGETTKTISVNVVADKAYEANENFYVDLTSARGAKIVTNGAEGLKSSWVSATIINDDLALNPTVGFKTNNTSVIEGNSGLTDMNFVLQLNKASTEEVTVNYTTTMKTFGTAKAGIDYVPTTESVTFAPGETTKTVSVHVIGDSSYESKENFYVDLKSATGASIVTNGAEGLRSNWAVGNIVNDDVMSVITRTADGIFGTTSKDVIGGTAASDNIYGKGGSDIITGFTGDDTFVFSKINATSVLSDAAQVTDFKDGSDKIKLSDLFYDELNIYQGSGSNVGNTVIGLDSGETLAILIGVNSKLVTDSDFTII